jgi:hypothetical protein
VEALEELEFTVVVKLGLQEVVVAVVGGEIAVQGAVERVPEAVETVDLVGILHNLGVVRLMVQVEVVVQVVQVATTVVVQVVQAFLVQ